MTLANSPYLDRPLRTPEDVADVCDVLAQAADRLGDDNEAQRLREYAEHLREPGGWSRAEHRENLGRMQHGPR